MDKVTAMDKDFSAIGNDGFAVHRMPFYAALYPVIREVARQHGYALAVHGSLTKDLDVVAVPWTESSSTADELVEAIAVAAGGKTISSSIMPHGRKAWTIHLGESGGYIDLSVMPLIPVISRGIATDEAGR